MSVEGSGKEGMPYANSSSDINHEIFKGNIPNLDIPDFFKLIFENSHSVGILILDKVGTILAMNVGIQSSLGYTSEDLIGKNSAILAIPEDQLKNLPEMELTTVFQKGYATDKNYLLHKDGSYIWSHGESVFTKNEKGEIFIIKIIFDTNEQKLLEAHLTNSNKKLGDTMEKLNHVNKDLETFVYTASHDLKAPVANIEALIHTLKDELYEECRKKEGVSSIVEMIHGAISKLRTTLDDLSLVGQIQEGGPKTEILFAQLLEDLKISLHEQIQEAQAIFTEDFSRAEKINFSRKNLRSVFHNLITNAIKYRSPERRPHVTLSTEIEGDYILLKVSDNGLGIKEEDKEKVFSMYNRLHHHVEGSGVGLSIVSRIINNNGGKIEIDSEVGKGTTFKVYFRI